MNLVVSGSGPLKVIDEFNSLVFRGPERLVDSMEFGLTVRQCAGVMTRAGERIMILSQLL